MSVQQMIMHLWKQGKNTHEIAERIKGMTDNSWPEWRVHQVIVAERQARLGFKTIQGGAANAR